jgi:hypothetical protein
MENAAFAKTMNEINREFLFLKQQLAEFIKKYMILKINNGKP